MKSYHFDIGNSSKGPLGMCAVVRANSKRQALDILLTRLPDVLEVKPNEVNPPIDESEGEYINIYINAADIRLNNASLIEEEPA